MRTKNINDMTVREQLEVIKGSFCDGYCKHLERANNEKTEDAQAVLYEYCARCPINRI